MAGIQLFQPNGAGTLNSAGAEHPAPVDIEVGILCQLSFVGGTTTRYRWLLTKPTGSASVLSSTTSAGPSFMPDVDGGSYSISLFDVDENEYILDIVTPTTGGGSGGSGGTVTTSVATYDDVRAASFGSGTPPAVMMVQCRATVDDGGGGMFAYDADDTTTDDDDGAVLVDGDGHRFKRIFSGPVDVRWFGAGQGDASDDTAAMQAAAAFISTSGTDSAEILFPWVTGGYKLNAKWTLNQSVNQSLKLRGEAPPGAGPPGITIGWYGADNTDTMVDFVAANGLVVENIAFDANPVAGSDDTKGCKYAVWVRPDTVNSKGASDVTFYKCQFKNARNISGAAQVALGPPGAGITQTDNVRFRDCLFLGRPDNAAYLADGVINLAANNTKHFQFSNCGLNYNRYAFNFALTSGPVLVNGCAINANHLAAFLTADARITAVACDNEGNNAICHYSGVGAVTGNLTLINCEWYNTGAAANPNGGSYDLQVDFPGEIKLIGGVYWNQRQVTITAATNASPIVCTATNHRLATGDRVTVFGAAGNTAANGFWTVTVVNANTFSLDGSTGNGALSGTCAFQPEMKFRTFAQDVSTANGAFDAEGVTFYGCEDYPRAIDTTGEDLFDSAWAQAEDVRAAIRHCTGRSLNTDQPVLMPDIDMRAKRLGRYGEGYLMSDASGNISTQASGQGVSAVRILRGMPFIVEADADVNEYGEVVINTTAGTAVKWPIEVPDGCSLTGVELCVIGGGNGALPAVMPGFRVRTLRISNENQASQGIFSDASINTTQYNAIHSIEASLTPITIDNQDRRYTIEFFSESGANAATGYKVIGIYLTFTPTVPDRGAA